MGQKMLTNVQYGIETTWGTLVPATAIGSGLTVARHKRLINNLHPEEFRGDMFRFHKSAVVGRMANLHLEGYACFDDLAYFAAMGIKGGVSATADSGTPTPAQTRNYAPAGSSVDVPDTYTIEAGDNSVNWAYAGCFITALQLAAARDGLTTLQADLIARDFTQQAKTGSLSQRDPEYIPANLWTFKVDDTGGTLGTTLYGASSLLNFTWRIAQFDAFKTMDGTQLLSGITEQGLAAALTVTVMVDASFVAILTKHINQSRLLTRLENIGSLIHGTPNTFKRVRLDGAYILKDVGEIGGSDEKGKQTVQLTFESELDSTASLYYALNLVNSLATLP
jgi:hypothetical protein